MENKQQNRKNIFKLSRAARRFLSGALCAVLASAALFTCLSFSFSISQAQQLKEQQKTGGDDVITYLPLSSLRAPYVEPKLPLYIDAAPSPEQIDIHITGRDGEPVTGIEFEVIVTNEDGLSGSYIDSDMDGLVVCPKPDPGTYTVALSPVADYITPEPVLVTVEKKVEHVKVDVSDKILSEKDVNVKTEDKQAGAAPPAGGSSAPATSGDTVELVESQKILVSSETVEKPVKDENGNELWVSIPELRDNFLVYADGSASPLKATLNADGTLAKAERFVETVVETPADTPVDTPAEGEGETEGEGEAPAEPTAPVTPAEPQGEWKDCTGEVVDRFGKPVADANGNPVFLFVSSEKKTESVVEEVYSYRGWQTIDGKTYYYDKNGSYVTGAQVIGGKNYFFSDNGARLTTMGIDVSTWNASIDWNKVKASGVEFVIIRCGYRGYTLGGLIEDSRFRTNIAGATAAGLKVGVYFFTQAITELEAVEEASMCLQLVSGYRLAYPIFMDMEDGGSPEARANKLSNSQRTAIVTAFCDTIRAAGYRSGLYANKYYLNSKIATSSLSSNIIIWLAHYVTMTDYAGRYEMWQYSSTGSVPGISGNVDMNISYLNY